MILDPHIELKTIDGTIQHLGDYEGKVLLIVNVASQCGFTSQYKGLEALYRRFSPRGFSVLGFPCNQFGYQEPQDENAIQHFCSTHYDVTFPLFAKIAVNGAQTHPLYATLKKAAPGVLNTEAIKWNFTKFLVHRDHTPLKRYAPTETPETLVPDIEAAL